MRTPLAWRNLVHARARTLVAACGVAFAVMLILVQFGFYSTVLRTATMVYDRIPFDLQLRSKSYLTVSSPGEFHRTRINLVGSDDAVASITPLRVGFNLWRTGDYRRRVILVMGHNPKDQVFDLPGLSPLLPRLGELPDTALLDRQSRKDFQPREVGQRLQLGFKQLTLVGQFDLGTGFAADGALLVSDQTYLRLFPQCSLERVNLAFIHLKPGNNPDQVAARLRGLLPADVTVVTRKEVERQERNYWMIKTSVGIIFASSVLVAILVGMAIVYQVLSSDVSERLSEYATLKAMGYSGKYLSRVLVEQAVILSVLGFGPGFLFAWGVHVLTRTTQNLPMYMSWERSLAVFVLSMVMCIGAALLSSRKVHQVDPADLF